MNRDLLMSQHCVFLRNVKTRAEQNNIALAGNLLKTAGGLEFLEQAERYLREQIEAIQWLASELSSPLPDGRVANFTYAGAVAEFLRVGGVLAVVDAPVPVAKVIYWGSIDGVDLPCYGYMSNWRINGMPGLPATEKPAFDLIGKVLKRGGDFVVLRDAPGVGND